MRSSLHFMKNTDFWAKTGPNPDQFARKSPDPDQSPEKTDQMGALHVYDQWPILWLLSMLWVRLIYQRRRKFLPGLADHPIDFEHRRKQTRLGSISLFLYSLYWNFSSLHAGCWSQTCLSLKVSTFQFYFHRFNLTCQNTETHKHILLCFRVLKR